MSDDELPNGSTRRGADASATPPTAAATTGPVRDLVPFRDAVRAWFAISLQTFGGPAGQIAVMQRTLVEELDPSGKWLVRDDVRQSGC